MHGFGEMGFAFDEELDSDFGIVNQAFPGVPQRGAVPISWLMHALWARGSYRNGPLHEASEQERCIAHYFAHALCDANLGGLLTPGQAQFLTEEDPIERCPRAFCLIWQCDPSLGERFSSPGATDFAAWCREEGARRWQILAHPLVALAVKPKRTGRRGPLRGVNLFGHALARLGIGEDVRMAARALDAAGIPYVIRNIDAGAAGNEEDAERSRLSDRSPYDINLFCMTGITTLQTCLDEGFGLLEGRHNIGLWPWELPEWPELWKPAWDCVDEVWAASRFTYEAYARAARCPVLHMPMAVVVDATQGAVRADFGLPEDTFLFGFSFDGLSSFTRKNPVAVIEAFRRAFPRGKSPPGGERRIGLVMKGLRVQGNPAWTELMDAIGDDPRIHVVTESLPRGRLLDLYRSLDAFVSLHRSEGFGRNIAEAMLLGKPVIVSAHSGNMDFTRHDTAALVPVRLRPVEAGEYPFGAGQIWGEPDIDATAEHMRRMAGDDAWRRSLAAAGQALVARTYSPEAVGEAWARRLQELI